MTRIEQLKAQIADTDKALDALLALDELSDDQHAEHDNHVASRLALVAQLGKAISLEEGRIARQRETEELGNRIDAVQDAAARRPNGVGRKTDAAASNGNGKVHTDQEGRVTGFFEDADEEVTLRFGESRDAVSRMSYAQQKKHNRSILKSSGYQPWGEFKSCADFVRDGFARHDRSSFQDRHANHFAAVQGMNESIGSEGGYMVMPEFAGGIIDRVYSNNLWSLTDNYTLTGNNITFVANAETSRATGSRHGGLRGYWLGEGASLTASKPTLREITLKLKKLGVLVYLTQELIDDGGGALQQYIARKASEEFNFMIGDALFNGTGAGQPLGVLNWPSLVSVAKETGQAAASIYTENIEKMYARFYMPNLGGMKWFHNQDVLSQLGLMTLGVGAGGVPTYLPPGGLSSAPYGMLKGRPLQPTEFNATLGTQGDIAAVDFGQMLSCSKGGVAQAVSLHVQFLTDQLALRFIMRLDAGPWESAPITPYKGTANTQSSAIVLDTRS